MLGGLFLIELCCAQWASATGITALVLPPLLCLSVRPAQVPRRCIPSASQVLVSAHCIVAAAVYQVLRLIGRFRAKSSHPGCQYAFLLTAEPCPGSHRVRRRLGLASAPPNFLLRVQRAQAAPPPPASSNLTRRANLWG